MNKKQISLFSVLAITIIIGLTAFKGDNHNFQIAKHLNIFNSIIKEADLFYVDSLKANEIITTGINAMLAKLDPYTVYYPEDDAEDLKMMTTGKYAGIGSLIRYHEKKKRTVIAEPYEGLPAAKAGLKIGDVILSINGTDTKAMSTDSVSNMLRGEPGTTLTLLIERPGEKKPKEFIIERESIALPPVPFYGMQHDSIGYVLLESFTEKSSREVKRALVDLKMQGAKSYILDLRSNGGGLLNEAVEIVNLFVPKGLTIVTTKGKVKQANSTYTTTKEPFDTESPLVVLVDGQTASAAEIVSGSLQDLDRAIVVGSRTFGKGLVQTTRELPYNGMLKLTTSKYYIPSGRCIQAIDYTHRNEDGSVARIPDSLTNVFLTTGGREVRDGGGIRPDIEPKSEKLTTLLYYLIREMTIFDFATQYAINHPSIAPPEEFEISNKDYDSFKKFAKESGFTYDMQSGKILSGLKEMIEFEGYLDITKDELESLEKKLQHNLDYDLDFFAKDVKRLVSDEIIKHYYSQKGGIIHALKEDDDLKESYKLINDRTLYNSILNGVK